MNEPVKCQCGNWGRRRYRSEPSCEECERKEREYDHDKWAVCGFKEVHGPFAAAHLRAMNRAFPGWCERRGFNYAEEVRRV